MCAESTELGTLLWGELDNDESIDASLFAVLDNALLSIATDRVEVSHEDNRGFETLGSCFSDHVKAHGDINVVAESDLEERAMVSVSRSLLPSEAHR